MKGGRESLIKRRAMQLAASVLASVALAGLATGNALGENDTRSQAEIVCEDLLDGEYKETDGGYMCAWTDGYDCVVTTEEADGPGDGDGHPDGRPTSMGCSFEGTEILSVVFNMSSGKKFKGTPLASPLVANALHLHR